MFVIDKLTMRLRSLMNFTLRCVRFHPGVNSRAELVTLAPGLRPERRLAPLARGLMLMFTDFRTSTSFTSSFGWHGSTSNNPYNVLPSFIVFENVVIISGRSVNEDGKARLLLLACMAPKIDITVEALLPDNCLTR